MINIPIDLWPLGDDMKSRSLGRLTIANDGTGSRERGNYNVTIFGADGRSIRTGKVLDWPRLSRPVFELVIAALQAANYNARKQDAT